MDRWSIETEPEIRRQRDRDLLAASAAPSDSQIDPPNSRLVTTKTKARETYLAQEERRTKQLRRAMMRHRKALLQDHIQSAHKFGPLAGRHRAAPAPSPTSVPVEVPEPSGDADRLFWGME